MTRRGMLKWMAGIVGAAMLGAADALRLPQPEIKLAGPAPETISVIEVWLRDKWLPARREKFSHYRMIGNGPWQGVPS